MSAAQGGGVALGLCFRHISSPSVKPLMSLLLDACVRAKSLQSCLTLCNLMSCSPAGSSVHGILRSRILEWKKNKKIKKKEYWSGLPFPSPGDLSGPGIEPSSAVSPALLVDSSPLSHRGSPSVAHSGLSSVLKLGKYRLCRALRCSPTGGHRDQLPEPLRKGGET